MSIFKRYRQWFLLGFFLVLLITSGGIALAKGLFSPTVLASWWQQAKIASLSTLSQPSTVQVSLEGKKVSLKLQINPGDKEVMKQFADNLGVGDEWLSGVTFTIDEQSAAFLTNYLPLKANLKIGPDRVVLGKPDLFQSPEGSGSAQKVLVNSLGSGGISLDISDPDQVLTQAVNTGQIQLSDTLTKQGLWQLLAKVARIKIEILGEKVNGEIDLR